MGVGGIIGRLPIKSLKNRKILISEVILLTQSGSKPNVTCIEDNISVKELELSVDDPTCHKTLYDSLVEDLLPEIKNISGLHVNVSPGTPAMHAVWLILHAGGRLPRGTRVWSSQKSPETKRNSITEVNFPINTYLSEIRKIDGAFPEMAMYDMEPKSEARQSALGSLKRFASLPGIPLLVVGERGTGKTRIIETIVRTIKQKRIVTLACGGLASEVVDSMLFGHTKGAFTGALSDRSGLLKEADKGVLFLDEIQDLPRHVQRKLVRVLQDNQRRFRSVGSDTEESVEFELICASNRSISELSEILDKDFFDRISMLSVRIPALRECQEDLFDDWQHVWGELNRDLNRPNSPPFSNEIANFFHQSDLSGNFRDMQRLACLLMAYWEDNDKTSSISRALLEFKKTEILGKKFETEKSDLFSGHKTRAEALAAYKKQLAAEAKLKYGTWRKAAEALQCDEKTLRQDASAE